MKSRNLEEMATIADVSRFRGKAGMSGATTSPPIDAWHPYRSATIDITDLEVRVYVWRVGLDVVSGPLGDNLSDEERVRADRFARPDDRRRFMIARGALRAILADLIGMPTTPAGHRLRLGYGPAGKPFLVDDPTLRFNVSHSQDVALIAVTRAGEVGIDIERQRRMTDMAAVARLVFDADEQAALLRSPPATQDAVFYRLWTRKEALLKAMGVGIAGREDPEALSLPLASRAWTITTLPHLDGFAAALARPRAVPGVRLWSWPDPIGAAVTGTPAWEPAMPGASEGDTGLESVA